MGRETFLAALPPGELHQLRGWEAAPAHLAYRMGPGARLLRGGEGQKGGVMVVDDGSFDGRGDPASFCREVVGECRSRGFSGAVLDWEKRLPLLEETAARLDEGFRRRGLALYVPEAYGRRAPHAGVLISSALSGGSLTRRLEEAGERFGRERVVLALEKRAEDFFLPAPTGCGQPLSREELAQRMARLRPSVFFSRELCARYFTYMSRESGAHFVLFDDGDTLCRKVEVARRAGVTAFFAPWAEIRDHAGAMGVPRRPAPAKTGGRDGRAPQ